MKNAFFKATLPFICCCAVTAQDTHESLAKEIIELLSHTEICLNLCRDAQSTQEVIPQLKELAEYAAELKERQDVLPDFTPADDEKIAKLIPQYIPLQKAIDVHIERIINEGLLTPELAEVLAIPPDYIPQQAPTTN